jgi:hypothetical protein
MLVPATDDGREPEEMSDQEVLDAFMAAGVCLREAEDMLYIVRHSGREGWTVL